MIEQNIIDYIYDYIAVDDEDYRHIQNQFTERELIRLEHIAHLGLVSKTYKLARHNKLEHAYGTYWISKLCLENTRGLVDNKVAFRLAALLHGIGHLPFSYDSEHALVRLCLVHEPTRQWLNQLFDSVVAYANDDVIEIEAEKMKTNPDYARLHSWFAAYKIANSQVKEIGDTLGKKIVGIWLNVGSIENQLLAELDKIDYVLRDMHYAGLGRIELNFIPVLKQFSKGSSNQLQMPAIVDFIESTHDYLCDQVYFLPKREYLAQILDKSIARGVIESNISLDELLSKTDDELENSFICRTTGEIVPVLSKGIENIRNKEHQRICRVVCDCQTKSIVDIEKSLAGTNLSGIHDYCDTKGISIQVMPKPYYGDLPAYEWTNSGVSVDIGYDFKKGHPKHAIGALILVERWAPENIYGIELTCREDALRFLTGLDARIRSERYEDALKQIIPRHMPDPESEWDPKIFNESWQLGKTEGIIEELFYAYGLDWPVRHFLAFPEHWSTEIVGEVLEDVRKTIAQPRKRKDENDADFQTRREILLEYSHYLKSILDLRKNRIGWVVPSAILLKENGEQEAELDVVSIKVPKAHAGPVTLELKEVSKNDSDENREKNRKKLNMISHRVENRFGRKVRIVGLFNDEVLFERPK